MKPKNIKHMQSQSRKLHVRRDKPNTFMVESVSNPLVHHLVSITFGSDNQIHAHCTCQWAWHRGVACSHVMAALEHLALRKGRRLSFWPTEEEAHRQKRRVFYLHSTETKDGIWVTSRSA